MVEVFFIARLEVQWKERYINCKSKSNTSLPLIHISHNKGKRLIELESVSLLSMDQEVQIDVYNDLLCTL